MKDKILPIIAGVLVVIAILVIILVPKNKSEKVADVKNATNQTTETTIKTQAKTTSKSSATLAKLDEEGNVIINSDDLSENKITFIKYSENSKIELIAIKGSNGEVNVALGTCQSCNGSPNAYYNQVGNQLQCNNCGLTFPLSVIGVDDTGCHPIMIDETAITRTETGIKISKDTLLKNEGLFSEVVAH